MTENIFFLLSALLLFLVAAIHMGITSPVLDLDESAQVFMGKGLCHDAAPYAVHGSVHDALGANFRCNLDPGGFTVLVRYWSMFSTEAFFLKLLPVGMLLIAILLLALIIYQVTSDKLLAICFSVSPLLFETIWQSSFYFRAYSMQFLFIMFLVYCLFQLSLGRNSKKLWWILVGGFLLTSRYPAFINLVAGLFSYALVYNVLGLRELAKNNRGVVVGIFFMVGVIAVLFFYFSSDLISSIVPSYIQQRTYESMKDNLLIEALLRNLYAPPVLLGLVTFVIWRMIHFIEKTEKFVGFILLFVLINNLIYLGTSLVGFYPWNFDERFNSDLSFLIAIAFAVTASVFFQRTMQSISGWTKYVLLFYFLTFPFVRVFQFIPHNHYFRVLPKIAELVEEYDKVYVSAAAWPQVKYLFEYSFLRGSKEYPDKFINMYVWKNQIACERGRRSLYLRHNTENIDLAKLVGENCKVVPVHIDLSAIIMFSLEHD